MQFSGGEHEAWLAQHVEEIVEPDLEIVDPHHHLWHDFGLGPYLLEDLWADTSSGHNVVQTVFVEAHAEYLTDGPEHLRPVGESAFVASVAEQSRTGAGPGRPTISAIVGNADLRLGHRLNEVLDAHVEAAGGLFRGVRHVAACSPPDSGLSMPLGVPAGLYADDAYRAGVARLGERGFSVEAWHYYFQHRDFLDLARAVPGTTIVLNHFGSPLGVGAWAGRSEEVFAEWSADVAAIAGCPNVMIKLGGLSMADIGFGWHERDTPPSSDEFAAAQRRYYLHAIDCFGPERCMMESNFPVDRQSVSYQVHWNGVKKIVADFSADDKAHLFHRTARRVYRLGG